MPQQTPSVKQDFLNAPRLRAWCLILAIGLGLKLVMELVQLRLGKGDPVGADFVSYWTASHMALTGPAAAVYDQLLHARAEHAVLAMPADGYYPFYYPPIYLLACLPLSLLPYWWSLLVFTIAGLAAYILVIRRLLPRGWGLLPILAFPAVLITAGTGQNGFFSAALFGGFLVLVERRPWLAGICLGGLAYKPHLALAIPVALIAARRWKLVLATGGTAFALYAAAWLALGTAPWLGFFNSMADARDMVEGGMKDQAKMQGVFTAARLLHASVPVAYGIQALVAVATLAALATVCVRRPGVRAEGAALATAALLCTPYLVDYDLPCMAVPMAWVVAEASRSAWRPGEKLVLLAAYLLPLLAVGIAHFSGVVLTPWVIAALFFIVLRRAARQASAPC